MATMQLVEIVQQVLSAMDSDEVDSINETTESLQVVDFARETYFELINRLQAVDGQLSWLHGSVTLTSLADAARPTSVHVAADIRQLTYVSYNTAASGNGAIYRELRWIEPLDFLRAHSVGGNDRQLVTDGSVSYYVTTNLAPTYYTTFDDATLVLDSVDTAQESTIQAAKLNVVGYRIPVFTSVDTFVPDLAPHLFPLYLSEVKQVCFNYLKQSVSAVDAARSQRQMAQFRRKRGRIQKKGHPYFNTDYGRKR